MIRKHKHPEKKRCLCFRIITSLVTPAKGRRVRQPESFHELIPLLIALPPVGPCRDAQSESKGGRSATLFLRFFASSFYRRCVRLDDERRIELALPRDILPQIVVL